MKKKDKRKKATKVKGKSAGKLEFPRLKRVKINREDDFTVASAILAY